MCLLLAACQQNQPVPDATSTPTEQSSIPTAITYTPTPKPTPTLTITPKPTLTSTPIPVCSPLSGIKLQELPEILTNPFVAPTPGQDAGHHGIDLAYYRYGGRIGIEGLPILAILSGTVSSVLSNSWPYGNMVIVETPLDQLPESWHGQFNTAAKPVLVTPDTRLYCPATPSNINTTESGQSLYILYAHMQQEPTLEIGNQLSCGQELGAVGNTGKSGNPHLHLEFRVGPSGAKFEQMSHYINNATTEEMVNYCLWRVSGVFELKDPLPLLIGQP